MKTIMTFQRKEIVRDSVIAHNPKTQNKSQKKWKQDYCQTFSNCQKIRCPVATFFNRMGTNTIPNTNTTSMYVIFLNNKNHFKLSSQQLLFQKQKGWIEKQISWYCNLQHSHWNLRVICVHVCENTHVDRFQKVDTKMCILGPNDPTTKRVLIWIPTNKAFAMVS
jgi:hypothetical protein